MNKKIDMQYNRKEGYDFRFADHLSDIEESKTIECPTLYDLLREVVAYSGVNFTAKRFAVHQLFEYYCKEGKE